MRILFTGFTSRTIGSDRNQYDYMCNVDVLRHALELAGHEVDQRAVNIETDPCIEEEYDCALIGTAAVQGLSSRYKIGALWALGKFGKRAAIFPSDGKNVYVFPGSVRTCLTGNHGDRTPLQYFFHGQLDNEQFVGADFAEANYSAFYRNVLERLPHSEQTPMCDWKVLIPTHSWGNPTIYARHFGGPVTTWDPTNIAIPMQFNLIPGGGPMSLDVADGRLPSAMNKARERKWLLATLQAQDGWIKKMKPSWPVITIGNKRKARAGEGDGYIPENQLILDYYTKYWGMLAFGYPLAEGGWWRMRYIHAALAGIVTCCDEADARRMPPAYQHSRIMLERWSDDKLEQVARDQHTELFESATSVDQTVATLDGFIRGLV